MMPTSLGTRMQPLRLSLVATDSTHVLVCQVVGGACAGLIWWVSMRLLGGKRQATSSLGACRWASVACPTEPAGPVRGAQPQALLQGQGLVAPDLGPAFLDADEPYGSVQVAVAEVVVEAGFDKVACSHGLPVLCRTQCTNKCRGDGLASVQGIGTRFRLGRQGVQGHIGDGAGATWEGSAYVANSNTGVSITRRGFCLSQTVCCSRSTVSGANNRSPVSTHTLAGTFSTMMNLPSTSMA